MWTQALRVPAQPLAWVPCALSWLWGSPLSRAARWAGAVPSSAVPTWPSLPTWKEYFPPGPLHHPLQMKDAEGHPRLRGLPPAVSGLPQNGQLPGPPREAGRAGGVAQDGRGSDCI